MSSQTLHAAWADEVNRFWFDELSPKDWFGHDPKLDEKIRARFGKLLESLKEKPPSAHELDATSLLAAVIVLDQFSRNLFRDSAESYATDAISLDLVKHAVAIGLDRQLLPQQRHFLYMPYMHSEDRAMQAESLRLFSALTETDGIGWAREHAAVVERFGRFPHRNGVLGRQSTPAEIEFLKTNPGFA